MAKGDLEIIVSIKHKGEEIWKCVTISNDDILDYIKEREYTLIDSISNMASRAVKAAITKYDNPVEEKPLTKAKKSWGK